MIYLTNIYNIYDIYKSHQEIVLRLMLIMSIRQQLTALLPRSGYIAISSMLHREASGGAMLLGESPYHITTTSERLNNQRQNIAD